MRDLINRQAAIDAIGRDPMGGLNYARILKYLPTAEPKTGRWIDEHFADEYLANCSECGYEMNVRANHGYFNYCPNCGAKMKGAEDGTD